MSSIAIPASLLGNMVGFVELSSLTTKKALDQLGVHQNAQQKAASIRPELLAHMLANNVVTAQQKEACDVMLGAHDTTLQLLKKATDMIAELRGQLTKVAKEPGSAQDDPRTNTGGWQKVAGDVTSLNSSTVGKFDGMKESDKALFGRRS